MEYFGQVMIYFYRPSALRLKAFYPKFSDQRQSVSESFPWTFFQGHFLKLSAENAYRILITGELLTVRVCCFVLQNREYCFELFWDNKMKRKTLALNFDCSDKSPKFDGLQYDRDSILQLICQHKLTLKFSLVLFTFETWQQEIYNNILSKKECTFYSI